MALREGRGPGPSPEKQGGTAPGLHSDAGSVKTARQARGAAIAARTPEAGEDLAAFLSSSPGYQKVINELALKDPVAVQALSSLLKLGNQLIPGMRSVLDDMIQSGMSERAARQELVRQIIEEGLDPGKREQGSRAGCVDAQFMRSYFTTSEYIRCVCQLATDASTNIVRGDKTIQISAPESWHHFMETNDAYSVQNPGEDLLMLSIRWMNASDAEKRGVIASGFDSLGVTYARQGRDRLDMLTGRRHGVAWGRTGLLFGFEQARQGMPVQIVTDWSPGDISEAGPWGKHLNHCVGLQGMAGAERAVISNTWGELRDKSRSRAVDGPPSRQAFNGEESALESIGLDDLQKAPQWAWIDESSASIIVSEENLRRAGFESFDELNEYVQQYRDEKGVTSLHFDPATRRLWIDLDEDYRNDQPDLSETGDFGPCGFDLDMAVTAFEKIRQSKIEPRRHAELPQEINNADSAITKNPSLAVEGIRKEGHRTYSAEEQRMRDLGDRYYQESQELREEEAGRDRKFRNSPESSE